MHVGYAGGADKKHQLRNVRASFIRTHTERVACLSRRPIVAHLICAYHVGGRGVGGGGIMSPNSPPPRKYVTSRMAKRDIYYIYVVDELPGDESSISFCIAERSAQHPSLVQGRKSAKKKIESRV